MIKTLIAGNVWRRSVLVVSSGVAALVLLTGCGAQLSSVSGASQRSGAGSSSAGAAADTTVRTLSGKSLSLTGAEPTVLYFFTAGCSGCEVGAKSVGAGLAKTPGVQGIAIDVDPSEPSTVIHDFMTLVGNPPLSVVRDDGTLLRRFNVDTLGTTVVLNADGNLVFRGIDPSAARIQQAVAAARS